MAGRKENVWSVNVSYTLLHIATWSFYSVILSFSGNILSEFGLSDSQISLVLGMSSAASLVVQLMIGEAGRKGRTPRTILLLGIVMLTGNLIVSASGVPVGCRLIAYCVCCMMVHLFPGLCNGLGMDSIRRGSATNYSLARGMGSLGYSLFAYITGILVRFFGSRMVPVLAGGSALMLIAAVLWYQKAVVSGTSEMAVSEKAKAKDTLFLKAYPRFKAFLVGSLLLQVSHGLIGNFMFQIMRLKQGGAMEQGLATAICAIVELPVMFLFPVMMRKVSCGKWVRFAAVLMLGKPLGIFLADSPNGVYLAQTTQMLGYGLYAISSVNYVEKLVKQGDSVRAQSYLGASITAGSFIALFSGGYLCQYFGVQTMLLISCTCAAAGSLLVGLTVRKNDTDS